MRESQEGLQCGWGIPLIQNCVLTSQSPHTHLLSRETHGCLWVVVCTASGSVQLAQCLLASTTTCGGGNTLGWYLVGIY